MRKWLLALVLCALAPGTRAAPPLISHQGVVRDANGAPLDGSAALSFRIYADLAGGAPLWSELHPSVSVSDGVYAVELGSIAPFPPELFDGNARYLEVQVGAETLAPRQRLTSVPYALTAARVEQSPITSIGQLAGLPCNPANPAAGSLQITYSPSGSIGLACSNVYTLNVSIVGGIGGLSGMAPPVTSTPEGISCTPSSGDCSESFVGGTPVVLTATSNSNFTFLGWSGACTGTGSCAFTMDANKSVTATFRVNL